MKDFIITIAAVITHTPIWVWALYSLLLLLGFQTTRCREIAIWRMLMLPLVVATLIPFGLVGTEAHVAAIALLGLVIGAATGWRLGSGDDIRRLSDGRIVLPGEWWSFTQLSGILIGRYVTSAVVAMDPAAGGHLSWVACALFVSTTLSGLFLGRVSARLRLWALLLPAEPKIAPTFVDTSRW